MTERLESLDWVDTVRIGRRWPDRLLVSVTEHTAAARWGENGLLNVRGELFAEDSRHRFPELPRLAGPAGSEREVSAYYLSLRGQLFAAQMPLDTLSMDERGALTIRLTTGQEIRFGRQDIDARIRKFFAVIAPTLSNQLERIRYVDLRYTNGFAVGWVDELPATGTELADGTETGARG